MTHATDGVLLVAFGGPRRPDEIRPFLEHVLQGRRVPPGRLDEVARHYEAIGGRSPLYDLTEAQGRALSEVLAMPVHLGMWHSAPFVADVLSELAAQGTRRLTCVIMAALHDRSTVERYAAIVNDAISQRALPIQIDYAEGPHEHAGFIAANVAHIRAAYARLSVADRARAELVFTAHSVPVAIGEASGYVGLYETSAERIASALGVADYRIAYQSRSGSPADPWLGPDIVEVVRERAARGVSALVLAPIGFVCDHVEVLYDLDVEAAAVAREVGVTLARASTANDHPAYIAALAETVRAAGSNA